ncbi:hypothetical protein COBT_000388 [Conglomerata obtusa]
MTINNQPQNHEEPIRISKSEREQLKAELRAEIIREELRPRLRTYPYTAQSVVQRLFTICDNGEFNLKMLDFILQSLTLPKQSFIEKIVDDCYITARFLKYFPGQENFINYSDVTLLGHVLCYCLDFKEVPVVDAFRSKIQAHDIWTMNVIHRGKMFEIIDKVRQRVPLESVEDVRQSVRSWYANLEKQFN